MAAKQTAGRDETANGSSEEIARLRELAARTESAVRERAEELRERARERADELRGKAHVYYDDASERLDEAQRYIIQRVQERPLASTLTAVGVGVVLGLLLAGRRR